MVDRTDILLAVVLTAANVNDRPIREPLIGAIRPTKQANGRRRKRSHKLHADKDYDCRFCRDRLRRHINPRIARKAIESSTKLSRLRRVVERALAWLNQVRRRRVRDERRADIHQAFLARGCALICWNDRP